MIRLSRFLIVLMLCMIIVPLLVLSVIHYQGLKQFATQALMTQLDSEVHVTQEKLDNELRAITSGLRLLTGHETIIKGVSSLYYSSQVRERFESFTNRYSMVSSLYLLTRDGRVRENFGGKIRPVERSREILEVVHNLGRAYESGVTGGRVVVIESPELVPGLITVPWCSYPSSIASLCAIVIRYRVISSRSCHLAICWRRSAPLLTSTVRSFSSGWRCHRMKQDRSVRVSA